ncbi:MULTISPECIES: pentapeptide repeat-containing protein [unclassified Streptomyces]|uniref:pentapeptide repeat-containing protein n=1 Tax=unclassified Streptomyces TaxID=2593676 RepID=UPI0033EAEB10
MDESQQKLRPWQWAAIGGGALGFIAAVIWVPWLIEGGHIKDDEGNLYSSAGIIITGLRTAFIAVAAGAIAGVGLWYTHQSHKQTERLFQHTRAKDREQAELTREGQVTDRYVEAIKLLASDNITQRLGGIYSLGRIMRDSEKDHWTVAEVLAAFVRTQSPRTTAEGGEGQSVHRADIHAAITVIGRNPRNGLSVLLYKTIDLSNTDLRGYQLYSLDLDSIIFDGADLSDCQLAGTSLNRSSFRNARLRDANLGGCSLNRASFNKADLTRADLSWARMVRATVTDAVLDDAMLFHLQADAAYGWARNQVDAGRHDATTRFPDDIAAWLEARAEEARNAGEVRERQ